MKIFLTQDVAKVGRRHEIKDVADGFGRNVLIPQGKAILVDGRNSGRIREILLVNNSQQQDQDKRGDEIEKKLKSANIQLIVKSNEQGHLYAAIKSTDIAIKLAEQGIVVRPEELLMDKQIRVIGQHEITWRSGQAKQKFNLDVASA